MWCMEPRAGDRGLSPRFSSAANLPCDAGQVPSLRCISYNCRGDGNGAVVRMEAKVRDGKALQFPAHSMVIAIIPCHAISSCFASFLSSAR